LLWFPEPSTTCFCLFLLGHIAFLFRATHYLFRRRTIGAAVLLIFLPAAVVIPALVSLAVVGAACCLVAEYEALRHRADRRQIRHLNHGA
jgi:hypothetical protein